MPDLAVSEETEAESDDTGPVVRGQVTHWQMRLRDEIFQLLLKDRSRCYQDLREPLSRTGQNDHLSLGLNRSFGFF